MFCLTRRTFSTARLPAALDQTSVSVSKILASDVDGLMSWSARLALEQVQNELGDLQGFEQRWPLVHKQAMQRFTQVRSERADVGKRIHSAIEDICKLKPTETFNHESLVKGNANDVEVVESSKAFAQWFAQARYEIVHSELEVRSESSRYHGRIDAMARDAEGKLCLLEFKTKFGELDRNVQLQSAAYIAAYNEMQAGKQQCEYALIVQVMFNPADKDSTVRETLYNETSSALALFQCLNLAYRLKQKL